eukprot:GEZU01002095.1.p1 GENE.GEZU01002095.1~~GEZU01002095.1.p1  ORF type:complete len:194 (-),score=7.50 GEZU01002095.1:1-582(-)
MYPRPPSVPNLNLNRLNVRESWATPRANMPKSGARAQSASAVPPSKSSNGSNGARFRSTSSTRSRPHTDSLSECSTPSVESNPFFVKVLKDEEEREIISRTMIMEEDIKLLESEGKHLEAINEMITCLHMKKSVYGKHDDRVCELCERIVTLCNAHSMRYLQQSYYTLHLILFLVVVGFLLLNNAIIALKIMT